MRSVFCCIGNFSMQMLNKIMFIFYVIGAVILSAVLLHAKQMRPHTTESTTSALLCVTVSVMPQWRLQNGSGVNNGKTLLLCHADGSCCTRIKLTWYESFVV